MATKQDLKELENKFEGRFDKIDSRFSEFETKLVEMEYRIVVRVCTILGAMMSAAIAISTAILKFIT